MLATLYAPVYYFFRGDPFLIYVLGTMIHGLSMYILVNAFFVALDLVQPKWAIKYKIQDKKSVNWAQWTSALPTIAVNHLLVMPLSILVSYRLRPPTRKVISIDGIPDWPRVLFELAICILVREVAFYYSHRLLHHKSIYPYIHKKHHDWVAPISIVSVYAHPLEHVVSNLLPISLGNILLDSHMIMRWVWTTVALIATTVNHSGYHLPFLHSSEQHDFHHLAFTECYGTIGLLDWLHGTDKRFRRGVQGKRDHINYNLDPLKRQ